MNQAVEAEIHKKYFVPSRCKCGNQKIVITKDVDLYRCRCQLCGVTGEEGNTNTMAVMLWNKGFRG